MVDRVSLTDPILTRSGPVWVGQLLLLSRPFRFFEVGGSRRQLSEHAAGGQIRFEGYVATFADFHNLISSARDAGDIPCGNRFYGTITR